MPGQGATLKPWTRDRGAVKRETGTFTSHPCLDCLRIVRWESFRCYDCDRKFRTRMLSAGKTSDADAVCYTCGSLKEHRRQGRVCLVCRKRGVTA